MGDVVLVTHYYPGHGGGVEIVAFELARRLAANGTSLTWFASASDVPPRVERLNCRPVAAWNFLERRFGIPWPVWNPFGLPALWRAIGAARAVHVHDALYMGNLIAACMARLRRKRLVVTQHIGLVPYQSAFLRRLMEAMNALVCAPILRRADSVAFISQSVREYYDGLCRWKTPPHFVPNGVDVDLFRPPSQPERSAARASLGLGDSARVFLFIGRFVEKKGLHRLAQFARAMPEVTWLFAGNGPIDPSRWGLDNVRVYRDRKLETLRELMWAADLLVLPSVGEGFPLVVQEATAAGLPCLVSADTVEGYPGSASLILSESIGPGFEARWVARLGRICSGDEALPPAAVLAAFARTHWSWQQAVYFYERQYGRT
jgi:glycosyltransferase involved in cell wall biosynthesis